jgi:hypothetical protein
MRWTSASTQWTLNVACLAVAIFALRQVTGSTKKDATPDLAPGSVLGLIGVDWSASDCTLVIAVRPGCGWCTASASFYRELQHLSSNSNLHLLAISPDGVGATRDYLDSLGVRIADVRQVDFEPVGIEATPTLVSVNQKGRITRLWVGKLSPEKEREVFASAKLR